jgi:DNA-binding transcriptional ArsR family regulator
VAELESGFGESARWGPGTTAIFIIRAEEPGEDFAACRSDCFDHAGQLGNIRFEPRAALGPGEAHLDTNPYFCNYRNMAQVGFKKSAEQVAKYADMFSAIGTEPRLRIMQLLLSAHPEGLVVGEIQEELDIPNSTLSHHLDKLKAEDLVHVQRESTFLRYTANTEALQELLQFLYAECCTRNKAVKPEQVILICP